METPDWLKALDHTADEGIVVAAPDLKTLYGRAAWGMFNLLAALDGVKPSTAFDVTVEAADREALLVRWLSELNYRHQTDRVILARFDVRELSDRRLTAVVHGETIDMERHTLYTEIKAVTFHGLRIEETASGWEARIIFDV